MSEALPVESSGHPSSAVLLDHVTGTLDVAHHLVVATHLLSCAECQDAVLFWEDVGGVLLADTPPVDPPHELWDRCLAGIAGPDVLPSRSLRSRAQAGMRMVGGTVLPPPLQELNPGRLRWLAPGIRHSTLWRDHTSTLHFIQVKAGVTLPAHRHRGLELTCVLSGAFRASGTLYAVGDVSEEDDQDGDRSRRDQDHVVVAEPAGECVCIMATTGRLRFSGWMARLLQPVMPF